MKNISNKRLLLLFAQHFFTGLIIALMLSLDHHKFRIGRIASFVLFYLAFTAMTIIIIGLFRKYVLKKSFLGEWFGG